MFGHARLAGSCWWVWSGGSKQRGGPSLARLAGEVTFCHLLENVQHSPQIHDWILADVLSGGVGQTDVPNTPAPIGLCIH